MDNVVKLFDSGTYIVRVRTHDLYTFLIDANNKDNAIKQAEDSLLVEWMPEEATSSRRMDVKAVTCNKVNKIDINEDDL